MDKPIAKLTRATAEPNVTIKRIGKNSFQGIEKKRLKFMIAGAAGTNPESDTSPTVSHLYGLNDVLPKN